MSALSTDTLYYGDCLDWMQRWDDQCVDLIYLDPPFNSKTNYNVLYSSEGGGDAQYRAFADTWTWDEAAADRYAAYEGALGRPAHNAIVGLHRILGPSGMLAYLTYMAERLEQMHRLLKPTGSIYLHCDPTASHYIKALMDTVFGHQNFRNEVIWRRTGAHGRAKRWGPIHDSILFYTKSDLYTWNRTYEQYDPSYVENFYRFTDNRGRYRLVTLDGPGIRHGSSGMPWRGVSPSGKGRHWEIPPDRALPTDFVFPEGYSTMSCQERLDVLDAAGLIYWPPRGKVPQHKRYLSVAEGNPIQDIISDIRPIGSHGKERLGYPTQKPRSLLERIIKASSSSDDVILDPFCGCGTTIEAARKLNRRWIGIDISSFAIDLILDKRLKDKTIPTRGIPTDMASARKLAREQPFQFESWAVTRMPGFAPNTKQVGDGGIDGRATLATKPDNYNSRLALAQIKGGKFSLSALRDFIGVTNRDKAALGCYVTLEPVGTPSSKVEIANFGKISVSGYPYQRMQLWPISSYFDERMPNMPIMNDPYSGKPMVQGTLF